MTTRPTAPDDDASVVVLDQPAEVAALPDVQAEDAAPALSGAAQDYLRAQGITDPATWAAFRLGQVDDAAFARLLPASPQRHLRPTGIWMPTADPREPATIAGLVRLTPAQHVHRFATAPAGLAAPPGLDQRPRVVLCDNPLLVLRLHQAGMADIALVEDAAVLPPLRDWCAAREVVLLTVKRRSQAAMREALGEIGANARGIICPAWFDGIPDDLRRILGIAPRPVATPASAPLPLTTLRDLLAYAQRQLDTPAGLAALRAMGLDHPDLLAAYRPGYLPERYRSLLPPAERAGIDGRVWKGNALILPATDERGVVVDLLACRGDSGHVGWSLWEAPRGLLAPVLATACDRLVVVDTPRRLGRCSADLPALLLRGAADAQGNAARLAAAGVRAVEIRAHSEGDAIGAALAAADIAVTVVRNPVSERRREQATQRRSDTAAPAAADADVSMPPPIPPAAPAPAAALPTAGVPPLELVTHDPAAELAVFRAGPARLSVQLPWGERTMVGLTLAVGDVQHRDRIDLAVVAQRLRFAACAAGRLAMPSATIAALLAAAFPAVQALVAPAPAPEPAPSAADPAQAAALADLRDPALLPSILADLERLGWIGEPDTKALAVLAAVSRLAPEPVWGVLTATAADERFRGLGILASITPPEHRIHVGRLTDGALPHADPESLRHRLLILDDAAAITPAAATALRLLRSRGSLTATSVERDPLLGTMRTRFHDIPGPVAVLTAAVGAVPDALRHQLLPLPLDESPAHAARVLAARQQQAAAPGQAAAAERIAQRLHRLQRALHPRPVVIPAMDRVAIPPRVARQRTLLDALFGLITASALLHQHQRPAVDGHVVATAADIDTATRLVAGLALVTDRDLSQRAHRLRSALQAAGVATFALADVATLLPDWPRTTLRRAIDDLIAADEAVTLRGRPGQTRTYRLLTTTLAASAPGHLATPGHPAWPGATPEAACG